MRITERTRKENSLYVYVTVVFTKYVYYNAGIAHTRVIVFYLAVMKNSTIKVGNIICIIFPVLY